MLFSSPGMDPTFCYASCSATILLATLSMRPLISAQRLSRPSGKSTRFRLGMMTPVWNWLKTDDISPTISLKELMSSICSSVSVSHSLALALLNRLLRTRREMMLAVALKMWTLSSISMVCGIVRMRCAISSSRTFQVPSNRFGLASSILKNFVSCRQTRELFWNKIFGAHNLF